MKIVNLITREPIAETRTKDLAAAITAAGGQFYFPVPDNEPDIWINGEWYYSEEMTIVTEKEFKRGGFNGFTNLSGFVTGFNLCASDRGK